MPPPTPQKQKFEAREFGTCPRVYCNFQSLLPVGESDKAHVSAMRLFCPCCKEVYHCKLADDNNIDGAFFGRTFPHIFLMQFPDFIVKKKNEYKPTIYGFQISESR